MIKIFKVIVFVSSFFSIYACTVVNLQIQEKLADGIVKRPCNINFTINLESNLHTSSTGNFSSEPEWFKKLTAQYIDSTIEALNTLDCDAIHKDDFADSNFSIRIKRQVQLSALPQEWLTGLSFGLIPSWGTRHNELEYTFVNKQSQQSFTYEVDSKSYSHILLFPVFWISFIIADEQRTYKSALINFIRGS